MIHIQTWLWLLAIMSYLGAQEIPQKDIDAHIGDNVRFGKIDAKMVHFGGYATPECKLAVSLDGNYFYLKKVNSTCLTLTNSKGVKIICNSDKSVCKTRQELTDLMNSQKQGTVHGLDPNGNGFLSVRSKPKGKKIGELYNGDKVAILGQRGAWYKVRTASGLVGWSHGDWLSIEKNKSNNKNNAVKNTANSDEEWWLIFKSYRTSIAKQYNELSLETLNKMATSDTLKKCKDYDETSKVRQLIKRMLMTEPLEFAENRYDEIKNSMPTKEPKKWDKLVKGTSKNTICPHHILKISV